MKRLLPVLLVAIVTTPLFAQSDAQYDDDRKGVHSAVLDYVEGIYKAQPERIARSVSPDLVKFGYWKGEEDKEYSPSPMNYEQLHELAGKWNAENRRKLDESTPKKIEVLDVLDQTAAAKLTAQWGIDYFQLEKIDGKWMIRHVLWQSHPKQR